MDDIIRIELELTNTCNLKCPLCIRQTHDFEKNNKNFRNIDSIIKQLDEFKNLKYITIAGKHLNQLYILSYLIYWFI